MLEQTFTIVPRGPFCLRELQQFGYGQRHREPWTGVMRLGIVLDGYQQQVAVAVAQDDAGVHCSFAGDAEAGAVHRQVSRILSLDHDGEAFVAVGERDPVIGRLQAARPGLRPPLFHSPYEAAIWAILSARKSALQGAALRDRLARQAGTVIRVAGEEVAVLPMPCQLLSLGAVPWLPDVAQDRLRATARAALDGQLDVDRLVALGPDAAAEDVRSLPGIGPFYSALIAVRATGFTDVLPDEPRTLQAVTALYRLAQPPTWSELLELAEPWRPYRTWAVVLIRAAGRAVMPTAAEP